MIRVVVFFALVAVLALGAAWIADRPGEIAITWQGWRIETSVMVGAAAVAILVALAMMVWSILRLILRAPDFVSLALRNRRQNRRHQAISRGLIAIGAGDAKGARRYADEAARLGADEPLALLLRAQTAQLNGDREGAARAFRAMADRSETRLIGLRGLYIEAQRRDDVEAARLYAAEAAQAAPALEWAGQALLDHQCAAGDWAGALRTLENNARHGLIDKPAYRRQRAVLLTAQAQAQAAEAQDDRQTARTLATEAARLAPDLVPAAALAGRLLAEAGELRRAAKVIEAAWRREPHPDLAEIYTHLRSGDSARDRLARMQTLLRQSPGGDEGALALARAAIDAQDFATARRALEPLLAQPTQRTALLMAELEDAEHGDAGRAREWMARALRAGRDPAWTADGLVSDHWLPVSPVSGRLDAFQWKVPVAALHDGAVLEAPIAPAVLIEPRPRSLPAEAETAPADPVEPTAPADVDPPASVIPAPAAPEPSSAPSPAPASGDGGAPIRHAAARREAPVEAVIPLIHAPDDPGPEPDLDPDARRGMGRTLLQ